MSDDDTGADAGAGTDDGASDSGAGKAFTQADVDRIVADRVSRERQKYADYGDLKKFKTSAMTEAERAVAEAEQRGRSAALAEASQELVRARFEAAAAGRIDNFNELLEDLNLSKFVSEDGKPDLKAIKARVDRWAPQQTTDFDGGARGGASKPTDMNALIRRQAGLG